MGGVVASGRTLTAWASCPHSGAEARLCWACYEATAAREVAEAIAEDRELVADWLTKTLTDERVLIDAGDRAGLARGVAEAVRRVPRDRLPNDPVRPAAEVVVTPEQLKEGWRELGADGVILPRAYHVIQKLADGNYRVKEPGR